MTAGPRAAAAGGDRVDLASLIALRQAAGRLPIAPRGKILATRSGGHLSRFRGRGMEYDESRVYLPGDDPRNMDWRVTARAVQPHVKLFREERERPVWLLVDTGPGMRFGSRVAFKSVVAARAAALLAWAAVDAGDRVGGLVFDETRVLEQRPAARTRGLLPLLNALAGAPATGATAGGLASLSVAAERLSRLVRPGSLVFLLSDFAGCSGADSGWLARLTAASEVVLLQVFDPLETAPPAAGLYPVSDGQTHALLDTADAGLRAAWVRAFADRSATVDALCQGCRAHLIRLSTDAPVGEALARGLHPQGRSGGGIR